MTESAGQHLSPVAETPFVPPMPPRFRAPLRTTPATRVRGALRYFRVMARNPLEIWSDVFYREPVLAIKFLGRDYLAVHDPEAIQHIFAGNRDNYRFSYIRQAMLKPFLRDGLVVAEGETWRRARKALTPVFTPRHVRGFAAVMETVAEVRAGQLAQRAGQTVSVSREMLELTLDVLLACLFSADDRLDTARFSRQINRLVEVSGMPHPFDLLQAPGFVPRLGRGEADRLIASLQGQVADLAAARRRRIAAGEDVPEDFLTLLLNAGVEEGTPLGETEIVDNLLTFLSAGHETTARTLTWVFYLLSQAPGVLARVQGELDALAPDAAPADLARHLPWTHAVLKETMRLYPAAAQLSREAIGPDEIAGRQVEAGTEVFTSTWVLHRHESLWRDPDCFDPSRFLGEAGEAIPRHAYLPFGLGPRVCIGASFSVQEMLIVMKAFLSRFSLDHAGASEPQPVMRITLQPSTPVEMRIVPRG